MNRDELAARLRGACAAVTAAQDELTEIDSHFGDADHGVTMTKPRPLRAPFRPPAA